MDLNVFRAIVDTDPDVLLRSDVATADEGDHERLVGALLRLIDEDKLFNRDLGRHHFYQKLPHAGLAAQLRPYILDVTKGDLVRFEAIDIAEACDVRELQADLAQLALDESQPVPVRASAASTIAEIGDDATRAALRPLALGQAGDDPDDELKGAGLRAVWPQHFSAEELFSALTPPKRSGLFGGYALFLSRRLVEQLQPADLPLALAWVARQETRRSLPHQFAEVADNIMLRAWAQLDEPSVLDAFVQVALKRILRHDVIAGNLDNQQSFRDLLLRNEGQRRRILDALLRVLPDPEQDWVHLIYSDTPLVINADLPWLIERLRAAGTQQAKDLWSRLIGRVANLSDAGQVDVVLTACQDEPALARELAWLVTPIRPDSDEARTLKKHYLKQQRWQRRKVDAQPFPMEHLHHWLERFESGEWFTWQNIVIVLTFNTRSGQYGEVFDADLTTKEGWKAIDATTRTRITAAAQRYLLEQQPQASDWLTTDQYYHADLAAYKAMHLLWRADPTFISSLPNEVWQHWAPIILAFPTNSSTDKERLQQELVKVAYRHVPAEIQATLLQLIDKENAQQDHLSIMRKLALCWDEPLAADILIKAQDPSLKPTVMGALLEELIKHNVAGATAFAESLLALPLPIDEIGRERAQVAASMLLTQAQGTGWSSIWPVLQHDTAFSCTLVERVSYSARRGAGNLQQLAEDELADLFAWLAQQYPPAEDPRIDGVHSPAPRESVGRWRDSILEELKARGTEDAVAAIQRLIQELPEVPYLKWSLLTAQATTRRRTWVPPAPDHILALATDQQKRFVQDGQQLLTILAESLQRFQTKLHGETPAVAGVWNEWKQEGKTLYQPKNEERLSDFVKMHLDEDLRGRGVVANREVQIRRGEGGVPGERTDIHVDAIRCGGASGEDYDVITAIIEVKDNWHRELFTAMETQLAERYLRDNQTQHGLYLVGWFTCPQWDDADPRKRALPSMSIEEARKRFDAQAASLTSGGRQIIAVVLDTGLRG